MPLTVKGSASNRVKLLDLTPEEVADAEKTAKEFNARLAEPLAEIKAIGQQVGARDHEIDGILQNFSLAYLTGSPPQKPPPPQMQETLGKLRIILDSTGWDKSTTYAALHGAMTEGENEAGKELTSRLIGKALEDKIQIEQGQTATRDSLIEQETGRRGLMLDAWTQTMASERVPFEGTQQFRTKTHASEDLFTSNALFIPSEIGGYKPEIPGTNFGGGEGATGRHIFNFGFIGKQIKDATGNAVNVSSDAYTIDSRLLNAMMEHGGTEMRDNILRSYQTVATVANHDYIHGSVAVPGTGDNSPIAPDRLTPELQKILNDSETK